MANTFQYTTGAVIAAEAVLELMGQSQTARFFNRNVENAYMSDPKKGQTVRIPYIPVTAARDLFVDGTTQADDITETYKEFTISKHLYKKVGLTATQMDLEMEDATKQVLTPMAKGLSMTLDKAAMEEADKAVYIYPSVTPSTIGTVADMYGVATILDNLNAYSDRIGFFTPDVYNTLAEKISPVYSSGSAAALRNADAGSLAGIEMHKVTHFSNAVHTTGDATAGTVTGAVAAGATTMVLNVTNVASGTIKAGDTLIISSGDRVQHVRVKADATITTNAATVVLEDPLKYAIANGSGFAVYDGGGNSHKTVGFVFVRDAVGLAALAPSTKLSAMSGRNNLDGFGVTVYGEFDGGVLGDTFAMSSYFGVKLLDEYQAVKLVVRV